MKFQDYYEVLGVARDASPEDIRTAYRKLALEWHPDRHQGDAKDDAEKKFKQISEAHEVLSDPEKRKRYDQFGQNWEHGQEFTPPEGAQRMSREEFEQMFGQTGGFSDFFAQMFGDQFGSHFGGGRAGRHPRYQHRGADVRADLRLTLTQAIAGGKSSFRVPASQSCPRCGGVGFVDQHVCPACAGVGSVHQDRTIDLTIPDDVRDGQTLRLRGLGEPGEAGGEAGDLLLTLRLEADDTHRLGAAGSGDIEADVTVTPWDAVAGTKVDVRTPQGTATVSLPAGSNAGSKLRLRGQGLADGHGGRGDFILVVCLALPRNLSTEQRDLLRRVGELS